MGPRSSILFFLLAIFNGFYFTLTREKDIVWCLLKLMECHQGLNISEQFKWFHVNFYCSRANETKCVIRIDRISLKLKKRKPIHWEIINDHQKKKPNLILTKKIYHSCGYNKSLLVIIWGRGWRSKVSRKVKQSIEWRLLIYILIASWNGLTLC